ncbi:response regulator [Ammoniphilus sp. 3BR4]|uniref:response regulator n=1 Tax=Ammoniphilus sp. 3BR4 TaxID=3158265 RepID=UPI0034678EA1
MIKVLILDDDPMVAEFNKRYLDELKGFTLLDITHSVQEALEVLEEKEVDLLLLDNFMPGETGLELLRQIREEDKDTDVIFITAASDTETIQKVLRYGVFDYLIKPFEFDRFKQALTSYREKRTLFNKQKTVSQAELDEQFLSEDHDEFTESLPKGLTQVTLQVVVNAVMELKSEPFSTEDVAERTDISRVSVRKYLKFLKEIGVLGERMTYGTIGRPIYLYVYSEVNRHALKKYL